jgi:hypothetical protein
MRRNLDSVPLYSRLAMVRVVSNGNSRNAGARSGTRFWQQPATVGCT